MREGARSGVRGSRGSGGGGVVLKTNGMQVLGPMGLCARRGWHRARGRGWLSSPEFYVGSSTYMTILLPKECARLGNNVVSRTATNTGSAREAPTLLLRTSEEQTASPISGK